MAALYGTVGLQVIEGIKLVAVAVFHAGDGRQAARFDPQLFVQLPVDSGADQRQVAVDGAAHPVEQRGRSGFIDALAFDDRVDCAFRQRLDRPGQPGR